MRTGTNRYQESVRSLKVACSIGLKGFCAIFRARSRARLEVKLALGRDWLAPASDGNPPFGAGKSFHRQTFPRRQVFLQS